MYSLEKKRITKLKIAAFPKVAPTVRLYADSLLSKKIPHYCVAIGYNDCDLEGKVRKTAPIMARFLREVTACAVVQYAVNRVEP